MSSERKYRNLLPASDARSADRGPSSGSSSSRTPVQEPQKGNRTAGQRSACDSCRSKKIGCDGKRPVCTACRRHGRSECAYTPRKEASPDPEALQTIDRLQSENEDLRRHLTEAEELLGTLRTVPDDESLQLLRQLRSDPGNLASVAGQSHAPSTSKHEGGPQMPGPDHWSRRALPPSQSSLEFELMVRHPISYPAMVPVEAAHMRLEALFDPESALHDTLKSRESLLRRQEPVWTKRSTALVDPILLDGSSPIVPDSTRMADGTPRSELDAGTWEYCDERLLLIDITRWTTVEVSNELAARAISLYLETDHPLLGLFDADLFLDDFVSGKVNFCSPLLVNALLCWACQGYSYLDGETQTHGKSFYEQAKQLWLANNVHTLTAVAASMLLCTAASCHGLVDDAKAFLKDGSAMGRALGLFGVSEPGSAKRWLDHHHDWVRFASHTAWGVYSFVMFRGFHYHVGEIETPPLLPMPGDGRKNSAMTSDPQVNYHSSSNAGQYHPLPPYMGNTFVAVCELWSIAHRFIWAYYDSEDDVQPSARASLDVAQDCYRQMLDWADRLPLDLVRGDQITHHATTCHIYYHAIIADLFRPFLHGTDRNVRLKGFASETATPAAVFNASINQLLRLTLVYRNRFPSASYTFLWHTALLYVANAMLSSERVASAPNESRAWFLMCLDGYRDLSTSFPIVEGIAKGLLSMAMRRRLIKAEDARDIAADMRRHANESTAEGVSKESLMVDLDYAMVNPLASRIETLAGQFNTLAMWEEFTTGDEEEGEMAWE